MFLETQFKIREAFSLVELLNMYRPTTNSTEPILSLVLKSCSTHSLKEKISSHLREEESFEMEIR